MDNQNLQNGQCEKKKYCEDEVNQKFIDLKKEDQESQRQYFGFPSIKEREQNHDHPYEGELQQTYIKVEQLQYLRLQYNIYHSNQASCPCQKTQEPKAQWPVSEINITQQQTQEPKAQWLVSEINIIQQNNHATNSFKSLLENKKLKNPIFTTSTQQSNQVSNLFKSQLDNQNQLYSSVSNNIMNLNFTHSFNSRIQNLNISRYDEVISVSFGMNSTPSKFMQPARYFTKPRPQQIRVNIKTNNPQHQLIININQKLEKQSLPPWPFNLESHQNNNIRLFEANPTSINKPTAASKTNPNNKIS